MASESRTQELLMPQGVDHTFPMHFGLISDTHGFFDPKIPEIFAGVDHILHAGDIGTGRILIQLEAIAPVTAVLGNNDYGIPGLDCRETEFVELNGLRILIHHIVNPRCALDSIGARFSRDHPQCVIFGHTHERFDREVDGVRFVNPGYAGKQRFSLERCVARMCVESDGTVNVTFHGL
jgi:hypothetical protein